MNDAPSRKLEQFIIRFPDGMRDRIRAAAERNNRSMNAEIVAALEKAFPNESPLQSAVLHLAGMATMDPMMQTLSQGSGGYRADMLEVARKIVVMLEQENS